MENGILSEMRTISICRVECDKSSSTLYLKVHKFKIIPEYSLYMARLVAHWESKEQ